MPLWYCSRKVLQKHQVQAVDNQSEVQALDRSFVSYAAADHAVEDNRLVDSKSKISIPGSGQGARGRQGVSGEDRGFAHRGSQVPAAVSAGSGGSPSSRWPGWEC
jgi:hypothetical protein